MKVHLLVIDPQKDFCNPNGSLFVTGADKDMDRLALMVRRLSRKLDDIHITMDSHRKVDISHPKSISAASQALGTGGPSQALTF